MRCVHWRASLADLLFSCAGGSALGDVSEPVDKNLTGNGTRSRLVYNLSLDKQHTIRDTLIQGRRGGITYLSRERSNTSERAST